MFTEVLDQSLAIAAIVAFVSAMIQGYSGFGGGLVIIPILAVLWGPIEAIAITAAAALIGNFLLWPEAVKKANWAEAAPLSIALAISIPLSLLFLVSADPVIIRRGMGVFILVAAFILMSGWSYSGKRNVVASATAGALAGGITGGFGIPGGPFLSFIIFHHPTRHPFSALILLFRSPWQSYFY